MKIDKIQKNFEVSGEKDLDLSSIQNSSVQVEVENLEPPRPKINFMFEEIKSEEEPLHLGDSQGHCDFLEDQTDEQMGAYKVDHRGKKPHL